MKTATGLLLLILGCTLNTGCDYDRGQVVGSDSTELIYSAQAKTPVPSTITVGDSLADR